MSRTAQVVICGAGIAGISAAYHLAKVGFRDILIIDPLPPLSLTSDRSTECYRNWWPDPEMVALMNRSIDLLDELAGQSSNVFRMNRRGYLYFTADESKLGEFVQRATRIAESGAGLLRVHRTTNALPYDPSEQGRSLDGADLILDPVLIRRHFPYVTERAVAALHVRRAGWLSAQQLGTYLLEQARGMGVRQESGEVTAADISRDRVRGVMLGSGERIDCPILVNAAGPFLKRVGLLMGLDLPVRTELHLKVTFSDHLGVVDRSAPLLIWDDEQRLPWAQDDLDLLLADPATAELTGRLPAGVHVRPEGSGQNQTIMMLWDYKERWMEPALPPPLDEFYPEIVLRGLATMLPALAKYFHRAPRPYLDGGYYVKTEENRPLVGALPLEGAFVLGGLSGYGIMSSCAAGELLAAHVAGLELPTYAPSFSPDRYEHPGYRDQIRNLDKTGQL